VTVCVYVCDCVCMCVIVCVTKLILESGRVCEEGEGVAEDRGGGGAIITKLTITKLTITKLTIASTSV